MDRRRFLKYAGATAAVVGVSALGYDYLLTPAITGLSYTPTRVVNNKIYDIRVDVGISNPARRLFPIQVVLEPVVYGQLPGAAFTDEQSKVSMLQTTGLESELLSAYFTNLKGGREYDVRASASDGSAMVDARTLRTEYVREFENIAPLDDVTVIADYYTWYEKPSVEGNHWRDGDQEIYGRSVHVYTPLLGEYASGDPIVISKHIDWATGHGINVFCVSWWSTGSDERTWDYHNARNLDVFLKHPMSNQMKFFILYENNGRLRIQNPNDSPDKWIEDLDEPFNRDRLISDFAYLTRYFSHPSYLKVDGKPVVIFDYTASFRGNINGVFRSMRQRVRENGGWELYLVNDLAMRAYHPEKIMNESHPHILQIIESTEAIGYGMPDGYLDYDIEEPYRLWHNAAIEHAKDYLPYSMPGFEPSPNIPGYQNAGSVRRDPRTFGKLFNLSMKYATRGMIGMKAFNEWNAGIEIEPSSDDHGFDYLSVLKTSIESLRHA